ncbi:TetR/AcrR family transcriptional regulator [Aquimarina mytili]|uniref:TetR/AcrR family transcriptional regulator n=1 Tax=Aquimarina mytili TaxID=874423 RepID=A0A937A0M7_9FLAO|nr:TetR/AcrR family transcriptional regulator [Aquimarina mytili]MBL0682850.1 TetR/AcrR family transcriptional regulator [Aquimarina mytili]
MSPTKQKLLSTASKTFSKYGFYKTSMDEIAKSARKAKGSLYYHFNSKELLFREVVLSELTFLKEELTLIFENHDADSREIIRAYMIKRMEVMNISINYQETLRPEFYEFYEFLNDVILEMDQWEKQQITEILNRGVVKEELDLPGNIEVYAEMLLIFLKGLETPLFLKGQYERLISNFDNLIGILTKGISKV